MKLQFKYQQFQADAAKAVVEVFAGQPFAVQNYLIDSGIDKSGQAEEFFAENFLGAANSKIILSDEKILENLQKVQRKNNLAPSANFSKIDGEFNLTIEMETGVGKTYTYIKTMYELNKNFGWSKFIIVVPSIAIREGVYKTFQVTEKDFAEALEIFDAVTVYVKLPRGFYISTPIGKYNPDWAIIFSEGTVKNIYFVAETKGSMDSMQLRLIEDKKIECAREHFKAISKENLRYDVVHNYQELIDKILKG